MKLHLYHGRTDPAAELDDWGEGGPTLTSIVHLQWTYDNVYLLFATSEDCEAARRQVGWEDGPFEHSLAMEIVGDLVETRVDGTSYYFGDWCLRPDEDEQS